MTLTLRFLYGSNDVLLANTCGGKESGGGVTGGGGVGGDVGGGGEER